LGSCNDAIAVSDATPEDLLDGEIVYINSAFSLQMGYAPEDVMGRRQRFLLAPASVGAHVSKDFLIPAKAQLPLNFAIRCKDSHEARVLTTAWLVPGPGPRKNYAAFMYRAWSTEHWRAEPSVADFTNASVFTADLDGSVTSWNRGATRLTGYSAAEMVGRNIEMLYPEEERSRVRQMIGILMKEGSLSAGAPLRRRDGGISQISLELSVIPNGLGAPASFLGVFVDVTNLEPSKTVPHENDEVRNRIRRLEGPSTSDRALSKLTAITGNENERHSQRESEMTGATGLADRSSGSANVAPSIIQPLLDFCSGFDELHSAHRGMSLLERATSQAVEHFPDGMVLTDLGNKVVSWNLKIEEITGYKKSEAIGKPLEALLGSSDLKEGETTLRNRRGEEVFVNASVIPREEDGPPFLTWVIRDITKRKKAERALQEASERFEALAQNTRSAFWLSTRDVNNFLYMSPLFESMSGYPTDDMTFHHQQWQKMVHPDDRDGFYASRRTYLEGTPVRYKYRLVRRDGRTLWISSYVFPVRNAQGEIYRLGGLVQDVTDREEAAAQLQAAVAEKDALLREVHHRVKNNLQIISSLLRLQGASAADPNSASALRESHTRVQAIALLHEHLYQSDSASKISFPAYAKRLVDGLTGMYRLRRASYNVTLDIAPLTFDSETTILSGLILNELVSNALRHAFPAGQDGEVVIRSFGSSNGKIVLSVSDNGIGMPQDFDLQRANTLGLQLVRRLTRQLKGTVSVARQDGTTVTIEFSNRS